jgi:Flp pilus assembly protein TadG
MIRSRGWLRRDERGSVMAVELVVCAPLLAGFIWLVIFGGRIALAHQAVQTAAADAARAASIARTATTARTQAREWAATSLANQGVDCVSTRIDVDTAGFNRPVGTPATVTVQLACDLNTADLAALPGIPATMPIQAAMSSPLDTYRERTGRR